MITSPTKLLLMECRMDMLATMAFALRHGRVDVAKNIGLACQTIKDNVATKDYTQLDRMEMLCRRLELNNQN